jgi:molybdopterin-guanine dinucleotide biosynthesis protein A
MASPNDLTAFVLAGGKSTRMGLDKAFVKLKGATLLQRALETARAITPEVLSVGERAKFSSFGTVIDDVFRDRGPLGGIHAALAVTATDLNLVVAVDLPYLEAAFLKRLIALARANDAQVTLPRAGGGWQPLCAVYRKNFGAVAERSLLAGQNKIDPLFAAVKIVPLEEPEIVRQGFSANMFRNLNTPEDLEKAKRQRS